MAVLEKIRVKLGVFVTILIAIGLLSFIIDPSTISNISESTSSKYDVGKINGNKVRYQEFSQEVDRISKIYETMSGSSAQSEETRKNIQDEAWQNFVNRHLFFKAVDAAGIKVGNEELFDLMSGKSNIIASHPMFADPQTGVFSEQNLSSFINIMHNDASGQYSAYWKYLEASVYADQIYTKYGSLFSASNLENALTLEAAVAENNISSDVDFVMVPLYGMPDSTVTVSSKEIKEYYDAHKDQQYRQAESRNIEYVVFEVKPSEKDILEASGRINAVYDEFTVTSASDMRTFLLRNSDRKIDNYYYKAGELSSLNSDVDAFAFGASSNGTSLVFQDEDAFYAAKVLDSKRMPEEVYVKHILLTGENEAKADSLLRVARRSNDAFESVVINYSIDYNPVAEQVGAIGWMSQTRMIAGMENVLDAKVNEPYIVKTQYGTHIVKVTEQKNVELRKKVAVLVKNITSSNETNNSFYSQANTLATLAKGNLEDFRAAVKEQNLYAHPVTRMLETAERLGSIENTKEVTRWAFEQKKPGKVSGIISIGNNFYIVAACTGVSHEGYTPVEEVASMIKDQLEWEKTAEKETAKVAEKIAGLSTLDQIAEALGTTVSSSENVTFASMTSQGLDPKFIGALSSAEVGKICGPVTGNIGIYVFSVKDRETGAFYTEDDARNASANINQYMLQTILPVMSEKKVEDHRARFF